MLALIALAGVSICLATWGFRSIYLHGQDKRVRERLERVTQVRKPAIERALIRDMKLSAIPVLDRMLQKFRFIHRLETLLIQADVSMRAGPFFMMILMFAALGALIATEVFHRNLLALGAAPVLGSLPLVVVYRKKQKRIRQFEERLPDALDLITGALRSGMAFTGALQLVAEESPDPISKEFTIVFEENRLGMDLAESLEKMTQRVDSRELRIFVTAIVLQRDTGGNLAEILEGTAEIIRDRFRILGDVRTMTAQARLSGMILAFLPIVMAVALTIIAPGYFGILLHDPVGPYLIVFAVALQIIGFFIIRKIVAIKV